MKIIIPAKNKFDELLIEKPPKINGFKRDKLYYLLSKIYTGINDGDGVSLSSSILQNVLGKNYLSYLEYLTNNGVIRTVSGYVVGEKCRSFELIWDSRQPEWYTIQDFTFRRHLKGIDKNLKVQKKYPYLYKWMEGLKINAIEAETFAFQEYLFKSLYPQMQVIDKNHRLQYRHNRIIIEYFKARVKPFIVDDKGRRLHTLLTRSSRTMRHFITYNGQELVSLDVKNCQPYLLTCLLREEFWKKKETTPTTNPLFLYGLGLSSKFISSIMLGHSSESQYDIEFERYKTLAARGLIYENFENKLSFSKSIIDSGKVRDDIKMRMMLCLYSRNRGKSAGMKTAFRKEFPKIYSLICKIKEKKHNTLAILLQRIESYLILDVICKRISIEKPLLPIFTIHDSIVTTIGNEEYVRQIIEEEMFRFVGIEPKISIEYWKLSISWVIYKSLIGQIAA